MFSTRSAEPREEHGQRTKSEVSVFHDLGVTGGAFQGMVRESEALPDVLLGVRRVSIQAQTALVILAPPEAQDFARHFSAEADRIPAHITLLYPFAPPSQMDTAMTRLRSVCAGLLPFRISLNRYGRFQTTLFLEPSDPEPILRVFRRLKQEFPEYPPYDGLFGPNLRPHLTLRSFPTPSDLDQVTLPPLPAFTFYVDQLHVLISSAQEPGVWRALRGIPLGESTPAPALAESPSSPVRRMFGRIAKRYDRMNRLMTVGQDVRWRREVIRRAAPTSGSRLLDLGAGTGDLALEALRQEPRVRVIAVDITPQMIAVGRSRPSGRQLDWIIADAHDLPFPEGTFEAVVSGFLMRSVGDIDHALGEQRRVLRPGRRLVSLDTIPPRAGLLRPLIRLYLGRIIPALGRWATGDSEAYGYLSVSTERFLAAEALAERIRAAGFEGVGLVRRMFGTVAIHWGSKGQ